MDPPCLAEREAGTICRALKIVGSHGKSPRPVIASSYLKSHFPDPDNGDEHRFFLSSWTVGVI